MLCCDSGFVFMDCLGLVLFRFVVVLVFFIWFVVLFGWCFGCLFSFDSWFLVGGICEGLCVVRVLRG